MAINFKLLKGRTFNVGNKTAALVNKLEVGAVVTMEVYDIQEFTPEKNFDGSPYDGEPMLYFICEYQDKKGYRIKCNDADCIDFIVKNNKSEFTIEVAVDTYVDTRSSKERKRFDLQSWS